MLVRAVASFSGCNKCCLALLNTFISSVTFSIRPAATTGHTRANTRRFIPNRPFSISQSWRSDLVQSQEAKHDLPEEHAGLEAEFPTEPNVNLESTNSAPWYLEIDTPQRASNQLLERQRIPELPPDPPPLLKPMLEHISIDLGLDDLTIFDLRKIDPPPALGANLMMVLGTARSEKHLHVSADRFCRWLKVTHKLTPYADGLLGRGELKLKMRRKARRAKILSNVGSSEKGNADDGIRTGWICVNVGTIEDGRKSTQNLSKQDGHVGFGGEADGAKLVIQMLTEEKREELDLEDLWGKVSWDIHTVNPHSAWKSRSEEMFRSQEQGAL